MNEKPDFIRGEIVSRQFDGVSDDLLTGGFGKTGLTHPPPPFEDPEFPTARELRSHSIHNNYRGLMDLSPAGGYGLLYGPGVSAAGIPVEGEGMIPGKEYLAYADDGAGSRNGVLMVQIPDGFDPENPCIVAAASSGSRGIYGAVGVVGEWALKRGFAAAYTDKGTGIGIHDLDSNTVNTLTGERTDAASAGRSAHFCARMNDPDEFRRVYPHRIAVKHAHSRQNPEKDWGRYLLQAIRFAFYILNLPENFGRADDRGIIRKTILPKDTLVIASGISNGGGAAIRAAEQDADGLIDGIAVSEPNVTPPVNPDLVIQQGERVWRYPNHSRSLLDYHTLLALYQPCADLAPQLKGAPFNAVDRKLCENRCRGLYRVGLLHSDRLGDQSLEAQRILNDSGLPAEQNWIQPAHFAFTVSEGIAVTYAHAYGRFGVEDSLCGFGFAGVDDRLRPAPLDRSRLAAQFAQSTGIPPSPPVFFSEAQVEALSRMDPDLAPPVIPLGEVELINTHSRNGPTVSRYSVSEDGVMDMNLVGMLCLRRLATGRDEAGNPLTGKEWERHRRVQSGIDEIRACGNLGGLPAVIVHGRSDAILPPNHTARPYFAVNALIEGDRSRLRYYEITNAHHMDAFNGLPGFSALFVPLHRYLIQALDLIHDHLKQGAPLPPSQVVRTLPRGVDADGNAAPITPEHVPPVSTEPDSRDRIRMTDKTLRIPD